MGENRFIALAITSIIIGFLYKLINRILSENKGNSLKLNKIPTVSGGLPLIGHGLSIALDKKGFLSKCFKQYGDIFQLKFFRKKVVVLGGKEHTNNLFKADSTHLAFYDRLASMYFEAGLRSKNGLKLKDMMHIIKTVTIAQKPDVYLPIIHKEVRPFTLKNIT